MKKIPLSKIFEIHFGKHFSVNIWFFPVVLSAFWSGYGELFLLTFLIAFFHELSHVLCAKALNVGISKITIFPFGISAQLKSKYIKSSEKEFAIAFSGPLFNFLLFLLCTLLKHHKSFFAADYCATVSLAMALINLVPVLPLDGGRIMKAILTQKYGIIRAYNFMLGLSRILALLIIGFAVFVFFLSDFNFSLILISAFLIQNLSYEQKQLPHITLEEISQSPQKLTKKQLFAEKNLCAKESTPASSILRHLSYDYFCTVHIVDSCNHIQKTLTESEILEALTKKGCSTKFRDI